MSDLLLEMGQKPWFRSAVQTLGLPLPMPQALDRADGAIVQKELGGRVVLSNTAVGADVKKILEEAGASAASASSKEKVDGMLFDGRSAKTTADLQDMYNFFHANVRRLGTNSRVLVLARHAGEGDSAATAAAASACTGFVKSLAKEIGKKGAIANVVYVEEGAEHNLGGPVRFFMSSRSTYVNGQPVVVTKTTKPKTKQVWEQPLKGQVALVTGAARGIGEVIARRLAEEGAKVIGLDVGPNAEQLNAVIDSIGGVSLVLDITEDGAAQKILEAANAEGGLDIVVNNAGITRDKTLANMNDKFWNMAIDVNLTAALDISEAFLEATKSGGRVICLSSIAGIAGNFGQTNYGAAKAGLIGAVKHLAPKFAAKKATINAVAPGFIETQMTAAIPVVTREAGRRLSNLGQGGLPLDVAELITFLVSPGAAGVNGNIIRVCGGNYIGA